MIPMIGTVDRLENMIVRSMLKEMFIQTIIKFYFGAEAYTSIRTFFIQA